MSETEGRKRGPYKRKTKTRATWGQVEVRGRGKVYARYVHQGKRYSAPMTFTTKQDARAWLDKQRQLITSGEWVDPAAPSKGDTLGEYGAAVLASLKVKPNGKPYSPKTLAGYKYDLGRGLADLHAVKLRDIDAAMIRAWFARRAELGRSQAGKESRLLSTILSRAVEDGLIPRNPMPKGLTSARTGTRYRQPERAELAHIVAAMPEEWRAALLLLSFAGLRKSELRALQRQDVQFDAAHDCFVVTVTKQAHYIDKSWQVTGTKSDASDGRVWLPPHQNEFIRHHMNEYVGDMPTALMFPPPGDTPFWHDSVLDYRWKRAKAAAGVSDRMRIHDLRGFFATDTLEFSGDPVTLQRRMRHASPTMSIKYVQERERRAFVASQVPALPAVTEATVTPINTASA